MKYNWTCWIIFSNELDLILDRVKTGTDWDLFILISFEESGFTLEAKAGVKMNIKFPS